MMPVAGAIEAFLTIWDNLPKATFAYIQLVMVFFVIVGVIVIILRL